MGPLPESNNKNSYILVVGDYFTHWMEATTVAQKLIDEVFCCLGIPG